MVIADTLLEVLVPPPMAAATSFSRSRPAGIWYRLAAEVAAEVAEDVGGEGEHDDEDTAAAAAAGDEPAQGL